MPDVQKDISGTEASEPHPLSTFQSTIYALVDALTEGVDTLPELAVRLGLDAADAGVLNDLDTFIRSPEVQNAILAAKRDLTSHVVERFKRNAPRFAEVVEEIAFSPRVDAKTRLAAAQDGLNRAGTGASQKVTIDTPRAYAERVKELMEPEEKA